MHGKMTDANLIYNKALVSVTVLRDMIRHAQCRNCNKAPKFFGKCARHTAKLVEEPGCTTTILTLVITCETVVYTTLSSDAIVTVTLPKIQTNTAKV
jgi:hypothetical protein